MCIPSKILNIIPHAGGGMGTVLRALMAAESKPGNRFIHKVAALEHLNDATKVHLNSHGIAWTEGGERVDELTGASDIVVVHWWNHPLLMRLLFNGLPSSRLVIWSHVNGFHPPQSFFPELFALPDRFVFATKASLQSPVFESLSAELKEKVRVIQSCAGIPKGSEKLYPKKEPFRIGYIGTVEPAKIHPDFLELCAAAGIETPCIVAGGPEHETLRLRAEHLGLSSKFDILGPVENVKPIFDQLHVFAYPLNPTHYGTGEQVLIEAMAYGAVPVVLANLPEAAIVCHNKAGIVAKNATEFSTALRFLKENSLERERLADGGHRFVLEECGIDHSTRSFHAIFEEALHLPKRPRRLNLPSIAGMEDGSPCHLFLVSCGNTPEREFFINPSATGIDSFPQHFHSQSRGTPLHYLRLLGHDPRLQSICDTFYGKTGAIP